VPLLFVNFVVLNDYLSVMTS